MVVREQARRCSSSAMLMRRGNGWLGNLAGMTFLIFLCCCLAAGAHGPQLLAAGGGASVALSQRRTAARLVEEEPVAPSARQISESAVLAICVTHYIHITAWWGADRRPAWAAAQGAKTREAYGLLIRAKDLGD